MPRSPDPMDGPDLGPIYAVLDGLRGRIRRAWALRGLGLLAAGIGVGVLVSFLLDLALDLPLAVRAVNGLVAARTLAPASSSFCNKAGAWICCHGTIQAIASLASGAVDAGSPSAPVRGRRLTRA